MRVRARLATQPINAQIDANTTRHTEAKNKETRLAAAAKEARDESKRTRARGGFCRLLAIAHSLARARAHCRLRVY